MMRRARSLAVLAIATVALAARCSGGEPTTGSTPAQQSSAAQPSSAAPSSTQPSSPAAPSSAATETSSAPASSSAPTQSASSSRTSSQSNDQSGDQNSDKPSKAEIVAGLMRFYERDQKIPADKAKKFATCMVDQMYPKAKAVTLRAMRDGDPNKIDKGDAGLIGQAGLTCQPALG